MANKRAPKRTPTEKLEDAFVDLDCVAQEKMLVTLAGLHRMCRRERARVAADTPDKTARTSPASLELHMAEPLPMEHEA